jgi:microcompartment protein CcmK/EutM
VFGAAGGGPGPDEGVLVASGSSARQTSLTDKRPVDAIIMAIVDTWSIDGVTKYKK